MDKTQFQFTATEASIMSCFCKSYTRNGQGSDQPNCPTELANIIGQPNPT
jgi:hypothetical protein